MFDKLTDRYAGLDRIQEAYSPEIYDNLIEMLKERPDDYTIIAVVCNVYRGLKKTPRTVKSCFMGTIPDLGATIEGLDLQSLRTPLSGKRLDSVNEGYEQSQKTLPLDNVHLLVSLRDAVCAKSVVMASYMLKTTYKKQPINKELKEGMQFFARAGAALNKEIGSLAAVVYELDLFIGDTHSQYTTLPVFNAILDNRARN